MLLATYTILAGPNKSQTKIISYIQRKQPTISLSNVRKQPFHVLLVSRDGSSNVGSNLFFRGTCDPDGFLLA
jgi:hypothetical protein